MSKTLYLSVVCSVALASAPALAGDIALDGDGDGTVTMSEFKAAMPDTGVSVFVEIDADADGVLSADEVTTARDIGILPETSSAS